MAKIQIKSEKLTPFRGIFSIMESNPIRVQFFVELDNLFEERIAFRVRASYVFQRERSELQVKFSHTLKQRKVLDIESLDAVRQRVVVGTFAPTFALSLVDFGNGDAAELVEALVAYLRISNSGCASGLHKRAWQSSRLAPNFAVEDYLLRSHVRTVDVAEDSLILRAVFQRKSDCQRVAVATAEQSIFGNILKRCSLFECGELVVDIDFHKIKLEYHEDTPTLYAIKRRNYNKKLFSLK